MRPGDYGAGRGAVWPALCELAVKARTTSIHAWFERIALLPGNQRYHAGCRMPETPR